MGSSHSYLQNLDATAVTPIHWLEDGLCLEVAVPDGKVHMALTHLGVAGSCSQTAYTQFDYKKSIMTPIEGEVTFGVWQIPQKVATVTPDWTSLAKQIADTKSQMSYLSASMPVNDDTVSRYSWSVHCATAAGKAKYAYCADPEPAAGASAPVAVPVTTVTTSPVNDDTVSRYSWSVHCATAAGKAKYAYCADPEPAASAPVVQQGEPIQYGQPVITGDIINYPTTTSNDDTVSRYSWQVHCATAAGKAKYAYCADPEPAALMNLDMSNVKVMHLADWCLGNDSAKAKAICPKKATGEYSWEENHCQTAQQKATNAFCRDHEAWKNLMML